MTLRPPLLLAAALGLLACSGCAVLGSGSKASAQEMAMPEQGICHNLGAGDVSAPSNDSPAVDCTNPHNDQTFATGTLPTRFATAAYDDGSVASWADAQCSARLTSYLGADDSLVMRSMLTWAWFRPSQAAWKAGSRWYRCDVVGGQAPSFVDLPTTTKNLLRGKNVEDQWLVCARGDTFDDAARVACSQPHDWRAVTTIKVGEPTDTYPGDAAVKTKTAEYCQASVSAYLGYPTNYDYAYTWFGATQWQAGNRRSVCWAKTTA